jgi:hypothetical protein
MMTISMIMDNDVVNLFFDEDLMGTIVDQINLYYYQTGKASSKVPNNR